jgi:peptidoglycan/xylan/chitin deacetylase (PgdA/CDA1 family)
MYHYVRDLKNSRYKKIKGLDVNLFKTQIKFLVDNFNIIKMEDLIEFYEVGKKLPEKSCLLTFDDGYVDHFQTVFPILDFFNIQGSFFVPAKSFAEHKLLDVNKLHFVLATVDSDSQLVNDLYKELDFYRGSEYSISENKDLFNEYALADRFDTKEVVFVKWLLQTVLPEKLRRIIISNLFEKYVGLSEDMFVRELYMNFDQMKCMKKSGMHFGLHGYDHYWLGDLEENHMKKDISMAMEAMSELIDQGSWTIGYPYGSYNQSIIDFIKSKGCKLGFTTQVDFADLDINNRFTLPRFDTNDFPPKSSNYLKYQ